ncbi:MAG: hypothetical protein DWQ37_12875 [Planctomycetota bacterium]|nr:MAG: hypothetical protein DWQ37_12875 [Planctomycetota bacterium]
MAIEAELTNLGDHAWAGSYYYGDGLGVNVSLILSPESGYVFEWHGCLGLYDRNYGDVTRDGDRVRLQFEFENDQQGFSGISPELLPIRWGDRHYLIPPGDVVAFCNAVNDGREPRDAGWGGFLLRVGDEAKPVKGFPRVPARYAAYLLAKPVRAEIVAIGKSTPAQDAFSGRATQVTINKGTNAGLRVGMTLHVTEPDTVDRVEIVKSEPEQSQAVITQWPEDGPEPKVGWKLSTRRSWR